MDNILLKDKCFVCKKDNHANPYSFSPTKDLKRFIRGDCYEIYKYKEVVCFIKCYNQALIFILNGYDSVFKKCITYNCNEYTFIFVDSFDNIEDKFDNLTLLE